MEPHVLHCSASNGTQIGYTTFGNGLPLVLVTSWATTIELQLGSNASAPFYERLCRDRTVVVFDRRGVGASRGAVVDSSLAGEPDDVVCLMDHLSIDAADFLGDNDGCYIVAGFAARHPERVRRIAWWCPLVGGKDARPQMMLEFAQLMRDDWDEACRQWASHRLPQSSDAEQRMMALTLGEMTSPETAAAYLKWEAE